MSELYCDITFSGKFKKDLKKIKKHHRDFNAFMEVELLTKHGSVPERMRPHKLSGGYQGFWECHILPDLLLIWDQSDDPIRFIHLLRIGSHSELF